MIFLKGNKQNITFELNEQLSFETGQEIEEMISISIDPDIVIQAYDEYVQVRGVVLLLGEYHRKTANAPNLNVDRSRQRGRFIEKVININDEMAHFSHRFPVEISVAKERIHHVEDVTVTVDSFDYELPTSNSLNIIASLHIQGILPKEETKVASDTSHMKTEENEQDVKQLETKQDDKRGSNHLENKQDKTEQSDESTISEEVMGEKNDPVDHSAANSAKEQLQANDHSLRLVKKPEKDKLRNAHDQVENNEQHAVESKMEKQSPLDIEELSDVNVMDSEAQTVSNESGEDETSLFDGEDEREMHIELSEGTDDDETDVKDITFLTELFEEEDETYTQVTIYIAQDDDSIESIAKRYEIPVLQLLKDNNLSADTIEAGQLITIRQQPNT